MKRVILLGLVALATAALMVGTASADGDRGIDRDDRDDGGAHTWRITITNLTPPIANGPGSQPLSPPLFVVHSKKAVVWSVGEIASHGLAAIAEDANNGPLESALPLLRGVKSATTTTPDGNPQGPIPSGATRAYTVETSGEFKRLSVLTMLVNTNDGFTGLDAVQLRGKGSTYEAMAYDAGSENNNQLKAFIPGPCCGNPFKRDPEGALIRHHEGIVPGVGELGAQYDWDGAVARIVIERTS